MLEISSAQENYEHFDEVSSELPMSLLISVDYYCCFFTNSVIKKSCGPVAFDILGLLLRGPLSCEHSFSSCLTLHSVRCMFERTSEENEDLKQKLSLFWENENVNPFDECVIKVNDPVFLD